MTRSGSFSVPFILFFIGTMAGPRSACRMDDSLVFNPSAGNSYSNSPNDMAYSRMQIRVGSTTFTATLLNNATVTAFKARLPMTVSMSELNGNEKLYRFADDPDAGPLPDSASTPGTIQTGDLMLYGSNTLVLFYKTFPTSYSYTRLGRVDNSSGLAAALGTESVTVTFELQ